MRFVPVTIPSVPSSGRGNHVQLTEDANIHDAALEQVAGSIAKWEAAREPIPTTPSRYYLPTLDRETAAKLAADDQGWHTEDEQWRVTSIMETRGGGYPEAPRQLPLWRRLLRRLKGIR